MSDQQTEGTWQWDSDRSEVTWLNWADFTNYADPPSEGTSGNCGYMLKIEAYENVV